MCRARARRCSHLRLGELERALLVRAPVLRDGLEDLAEQLQREDARRLQEKKVVSRGEKRSAEERGGDGEGEGKERRWKVTCSFASALRGVDALSRGASFLQRIAQRICMHIAAAGLESANTR